MAIDITTLTSAELLQLITDASAAYDQRVCDGEQAALQRKQRIAAAVDSLSTLLGPREPTAPGQGSIREMLLYSDADLQQHSGLALRLVLRGMEIQTATTRDLALVVSEG